MAEIDLGDVSIGIGVGTTFALMGMETYLIIMLMFVLAIMDRMKVEI